MRFLRLLLVLSSALQLFLFFQLISMPEGIVAGFGIPASESADMIGRRAGVLFMGLGLMGLVMAWKVERGTLITLSMVMAVSWLAMAGESFFEWNRHFASGFGVVAPMAVEAAFGVLIALVAIALAFRKADNSANSG